MKKSKDQFFKCLVCGWRLSYFSEGLGECKNGTCENYRRVVVTSQIKKPPTKATTPAAKFTNKQMSALRKVGTSIADIRDDMAVMRARTNNALTRLCTEFPEIFKKYK